ALCQLTMPPVCYLRCLAPHHELHSFPTRRSSDLCSEENDSATSSSSKGCSRRPPGRTRTPLRRTASPRGRLNGSSPPERSTRVRSEEHTSELQSRENIVCRLLLEKKKQKNTQNQY